MSRCFPYPPPGYEPRLTEHKDLLKKERHKGKKHRKENGREKGERKEKERGHKKFRRDKRRERRKNKDRDKNNHRTSEQETQKTDGSFNRRLKERKKHEVVKDIKYSDEIVAQKVNSTNPRSSKGFGTAVSKEKERSFSKMVNKSGDATQYHYGMVQKNDSITHTNKKGTVAGVGSQTRIKNGKNLPDGLGDKHFSRRRSSTVKQMEKSGDVKGPNKVDNLMHLACLDEQKFFSDNINKRKELDANSTLHENGMKTNKLPRVSPTDNIHVNGKTSTSPHSQGIAPYSSAELVCAKTQEVDQHKPQDGYSNGTTGSHYWKQQIISVYPSFYDCNEGYLKPPHPDTKYLSRVQTVPPRKDISECIDQDWLFSEDPVERKTTSFEAAESHQIWSDAQQIDTADVVALPYVVPL